MTNDERFTMSDTLTDDITTDELEDTETATSTASTTVATRTAADVAALPRGTEFTVRMSSLPWKEAHHVMYNTAHKTVTLKLRGGRVVTGTLTEIPDFFDHDARVWLKMSGRKKRMGVQVPSILTWSGLRANSL